MKRTITLLAICLFAMAANAQVTFRPGIRAGVNIAKITQTDFDAKADFYAGGFGAIRFTRFYTLQPEITYSRQGAAGSPEYYDYNTGTYERYDQDISIQYLSFGLISKFTFNDQFNVHVGPAIDFETGSNVRTNSDADLGIMAGVGYTFPFGLTLEARVKKGIIDVLETDDDYSSFWVDDYNTNFLFQIGLSYSFDVTGSTK